MTTRDQDLLALLRTLGLTAMRDSVGEVALKAARANLTHEAFLYELVRLECAAREQRRHARRLVESRLPREKTFHTFNSERFPPTIRQQVERLRTGPVRRTRPSTSSPSVGPALGKSHLLAAVGHALIVQGYPVLWTSTAQLMQRLAGGQARPALAPGAGPARSLCRLILDDIGYVQHDQDEMEVLFTLLSERYERKSVVHLDQSGLLGVDADLQESDDDDGGGRPGGPPRGDPRPDAGRELPRPRGDKCAAGTVGRAGGRSTNDNAGGGDDNKPGWKSGQRPRPHGRWTELWRCPLNHRADDGAASRCVAHPDPQDQGMPDHAGAV